MIGNTLVAEGELVANITLMRPRDMPTFDATEVRRFEHLTRHMARALQTGFTLEARAAGSDRWAALAALPGAVAVVDAELRPVFANAAMDTLLRAGRTLAQRAGRIVAVDADAHGRLIAALRSAGEAPAAPVWLPAASGGRGDAARRDAGGGAARDLPAGAAAGDAGRAARRHRARGHGACPARAPRLHAFPRRRWPCTWPRGWTCRRPRPRWG